MAAFFVTALLAATLLTAALTGAGEPPPAPEAEVVGERDPYLASVGELNLDGVTLEEAFDILRDRTNANLIIRWKRLEEAGVMRARPVRLRLVGVTLYQALAVLMTVADADEVLDVRYYDGIITISTVEDLRRAELRIYDVRTLLPAIAADYAEMSKSPHFKGPPRRSYEEVSAEVAAYVETAVDPESWVNAGGPEGHIRTLGGRLLITQTPERHERIRKVLDELTRDFTARYPGTADTPATTAEAKK